MTDRRAFMGALVTISAVVAVPAATVAVGIPAAPDRAAWNAAMASWRKATDDAANFHRDHTDPQFEAMREKYDGRYHPLKHEPGWADWCAWSERTGFNKVMEQADRHGDKIADAQAALFLMPSPDLTALRWKLDKTVEADGEIAMWCEKFALVLRSDIVRLLPEEA